MGPLKTIIDKELERSCVERSERLLADEATADSSTVERKVRQQVEQATEGTQEAEGAELAGEIDERASRVR